MTAIDYPALTAALKVLADPTRLEMLRMLQLNHGGLTVVDIRERLGRLSQPTISHHLRQLHEARLVSCRKQGVWARYYREGRVLDDTVDALTRLL